MTTGAGKKARPHVPPGTQVTLIGGPRNGEKLKLEEPVEVGENFTFAPDPAKPGCYELGKATNRLAYWRPDGVK